ncbi:phosphodiester glycosidase family protein [uncultured Succiniclasticum sp.]|uniref:phosphodiester glycosidase family protein n=1 Tax=uncultured Succiniclasticum sp. TaxID=1500547 RepID=UPI0025D5CBFB|nr:phosphodiester glycosidase family protein [uncultured Succiniclasticum sp.]
MNNILQRVFAGTGKIIPLLTVILLCLQASVQAQITGMRVGSGATRIRIVLDMDEPAKYKDNSTKNGVVLDIDTAANKMQRKIDDASIADISLIKKGKKKSQLVVGLKKPAQHKVTVLKRPNRLVIDVYRIQIVKVTKDLGNGLAYTFWQDDMSGLPVRIYALTLAPDSRYELRPFSGAGAVNGRGRLARAVAANGARAAVNACYFDTDGWVIGNCKWDGSFFGVDDTPRSAFIVDKEGKASIQKDLSYLGTVSLPDGRTLTIKGLNRQRITDDLVLFNRNYAGSTRTNEHGREVRVSKGRATEVSAKGNMRLDHDSLVLSGHGANADALAHIRRGDRVAIAQTLGSRLADEARLVVGGGPLLVEKGVVNVRSREESMASDIAYGRAPRTGVGVKADGTVLLMVVDGRSQYSAGMSLKEFATYLKRFGAVSAVNLDGGGSSEMVLDGKIMNRPSDGSERPVSIGLGIFRK